MGARLNKWKEVWSVDRTMRKAGFRPGQYWRYYYRGRLANAVPWLFPSGTRQVRFCDGRGGTTWMRSTIRVEPANSDLAVIAGVVGDQEYWEPQLSSVKTLLDLGSNIGIAALWFKLMAPQAEIACVEPDPRNLLLLEQNLRENGVPARIYRGAVAASPGRARLAFGAHTACSTLATTQMHHHDHSIDVELFSISQILDGQGWETVDLVKMDVEGAEQELFQHCGDWLPRCKRIVLEIHPNTSAEEIGGLVAPFGRQVRRLGLGAEPTYVIE